jgi:hypothetical protein
MNKKNKRIMFEQLSPDEIEEVYEEGDDYD